MIRLANLVIIQMAFLRDFAERRPPIVRKALKPMADIKDVLMQVFVFLAAEIGGISGVKAQGIG